MSFLISSSQVKSFHLLPTLCPLLPGLHGAGEVGQTFSVIQGKLHTIRASCLCVSKAELCAFTCLSVLAVASVHPGCPLAPAEPHEVA